MKNALTKMKGIAAKGIMAVNAAACYFFMAASTAMASGTDAAAAAGGSFQNIADQIANLVNQLFPPVMTVVVAVGVLYCVVLGLKFAKAEEPQEHEKAKNHLKNAIIGFVLIFVLIVVLKLATPALTTWMTKVSGS